MKRVIASVILTLFVCITSAVPAASAQSNTLIATWKLDVAKSMIDYGPLPRSEVRTYVAIPNGGVKLSVQGTDGNGTAYAYEATGAIDGKDYPMPGSGTRNGGDALSWTRVDAYTVDAKVKKAGVIVNATRLLVSMDGRLLTITENGTDQNGKATHGTRIYNRQ